jgi:hypothetical protein
MRVPTSVYRQEKIKRERERERERERNKDRETGRFLRN